MGVNRGEHVVSTLKDASATTSIPKLTRAVFITGKRNRTVSWDLLESSSTTTTDEGMGGAPAPLPASPLPPASPSATMPSHPVEGKIEVSGERTSEFVENIDLVPPTKNIEPERQIVESQQKYGEHASYDVLLGVTEPSPQYGLLGQIHGRKVALDLNQTHTISLFG